MSSDPLSTAHELRDALADLTRAERAGIADAAARLRDHRGVDGEHRLALFYALLSALAAEVDDEQRRTLEDLERGLE